MKRLLLAIFTIPTLMVSLFLSDTASSAAPAWGVGQPTNQVFFHPSDKAFYPFANFYEVDGNHDAYRYPATGTHNQTSFATLNIGLAGQQCLSWRSAEHFFQMMKLPNFMQLHTQWAALPPGELFGQMNPPGRPRMTYDYKTFDTVKLYVMYTAVKAKFTQNPALQSLLRSTGDKWIVEHVETNPKQPNGDSYWGDTPSTTRPQGGNNYLGKILMLVRAELSGGYPSTWKPGSPAAPIEKLEATKQEIFAHQQAWLATGHTLFVDQAGNRFEIPQPAMASTYTAPTANVVRPAHRSVVTTQSNVKKYAFAAAAIIVAALTAVFAIQK